MVEGGGGEEAVETVGMGEGPNGGFHEFREEVVVGGTMREGEVEDSNNSGEFFGRRGGGGRGDGSGSGGSGG